MKKTTYMVAIKRKIIIEPVIYAEVIAESAAEAVELVKENKDDYIKNENVFIEEALFDLKHGEAESGEIKFISCGKSSQYHSPSECKLCRSVQEE